jgi:hypothetical protein
MQSVHDIEGVPEPNQFAGTRFSPKAPRPLSSKPRIREEESRIDHTATRVTTPKQRVYSSSRVRGSVAPQASANSERPVAVPVQKQRGGVRSARLAPPDRQIPSTRTVRPSSTKRALGTTSEYFKPAIALACPVHSKIVVVSAQQVQREQERLAQSKVRHPPVPAIRPAGKAAFEALFNDGTDTAKATGD